MPARTRSRQIAGEASRRPAPVHALRAQQTCGELPIARPSSRSTVAPASQCASARERRQRAFGFHSYFERWSWVRHSSFLSQGRRAGRPQSAGFAGDRVNERRRTRRPAVAVRCAAAVAAAVLSRAADANPYGSPEALSSLDFDLARARHRDRRERSTPARRCESKASCACAHPRAAVRGAARASSSRRSHCRPRRA